jgi:hypothetical protein
MNISIGRTATTEHFHQKPKTNMSEPKKVTIQAPHSFTNLELVELGKKLQCARRDERALDDQLDSIKSDFKSRLASAVLQQDTIGRKIDDGFEMRDTEAFVLLNVPEVGRKTYRRADNSDFIRDDPMTFDEKNPPLPMGGLEQPEELSEEDINKAEAGPDPQPFVSTHQEAPKLAIDLSELDSGGVTDSAKVTRAFKTAAKVAGWTPAQIALLMSLMRDCDTVQGMLDVLRPNCSAQEGAQ